jgi:hypothetical protein
MQARAAVAEQGERACTNRTAGRFVVWQQGGVGDSASIGELAAPLVPRPSNQQSYGAPPWGPGLLL